PDLGPAGRGPWLRVAGDRLDRSRRADRRVDGDRAATPPVRRSGRAPTPTTGRRAVRGRNGPRLPRFDLAVRRRARRVGVPADDGRRAARPGGGARAGPLEWGVDRAAPAR